MSNGISESAYSPTDFFDEQSRVDWILPEPCKVTYRFKTRFPQATDSFANRFKSSIK